MITTERLILRVPEPRDRAALHAMWADPEVMAELGPVKDAAASDAALAKHEGYRHEALGFWTVERRDDGAVLGFCGLKRGDPHNPIAGEIEAGWIIDRPYWRQGYALEAMVAAFDWGWAHFDAARIVAITSAINLKSQRLMERLGMHRLADGNFDHVMIPEGDPLRSMVTYAITRP
ncbi:MAG: GNAT family N-acetyltransferase [Sphingomonas sp.]|uniref:GNAT family N-acetyltransferase n=1 Tax=Sphingomonas sp. TaxID=28214 RepID=UPI0025D99EE9|nr:GNAT family N-acetyltransferase [Sphingomonas sp.]MBY0284291.1 GNAT family N-acetyltransferase [Sphingomonas sp.]